ncbi:MAG: hypothetical protein V1874_12620 [Spirochaetota bacterium]
MKRLLTIWITIFIALAFLNSAQAERKETKAKEGPCVADCQKENKKCKNAAKKAKKTERKAKTSECEKALIDCKANCDKPKEPEKNK